MTDHADGGYTGKNAMLERIAELEGEVARLQKIDTMRKAVFDSRNARIAELEGEIERLTAERNALRDHLADEVTRFNICIAELEGEVAKLDRDFNTLAQESFSLRAENERLREGATEAAQWLETRPDYTEGDAAVSSMLRALLSTTGESKP